MTHITLTSVRLDIPISDMDGGGATTSEESTPTDSHPTAMRPNSIARLPETSASAASGCGNGGPGRPGPFGHSRNSSWDMRFNGGASAVAVAAAATASASAHSRNASVDMRVVPTNALHQHHLHQQQQHQQHSRTSSADLNKFMRTGDISLVLGAGVLATTGWTAAGDPMRVQIVRAHHNWIAVAYAHFVTCYALKDSSGWQLVFTSPHIEAPIERLAINAKLIVSSGGEQVLTKMVAIAGGQWIRLWRIGDGGERTDVGVFSLNVRVEFLFFIGSQLVALSSSGKIGVWHAMTQHWQIQDLEPILSFDTAGSFLLLGCTNGSIYYIGMMVVGVQADSVLIGSVFFIRQTCKNSRCA